jgi:hypothetical protein
MNRAIKMTAFLVLAAVFVCPVTGAEPALAGDDKAKEEEAARLGVEAYIYGYPLVTMEMTRRVGTNTATPKGAHGPMGQFANLREYPTPAFKDVTAPNADTLYSSAFLDLAKEPYILSLPDEDDRYYLMPMLSGWTDVFEVPGKRTTGTKAQKYVITGPNWKGELPKDITEYKSDIMEYKSPTSMVWLLGRTYCTGTPQDYKAVHTIQDQYSVVPLSAYGKPYTPPKGKVDPTIDMKTPVRDQVNRMDAATYFATLAMLITQEATCPCHKGLWSSYRIANNRTSSVALVGRLGPPTPGMQPTRMSFMQRQDPIPPRAKRTRRFVSR